MNDVAVYGINLNANSSIITRLLQVKEVHTSCSKSGFTVIIPVLFVYNETECVSLWEPCECQ